MSQQINLLNSASRKEPFSLSSPKALVYGVAAAIALTACLAVYENYRLRGMEAEAVQVAAMAKEAVLLQDRKAGEQAARKPDAELELRIRELEAQLKARQEIVAALRRGLVGTTEGFSEYMRAFSHQSVQGVWLTAFDLGAGGEELTISGRAVTADLVPTYLDRLKGAPPLQGREFASMAINQSALRTPAPDALDPKDLKRARPPLDYAEFTISSVRPGGDDRKSEQRRAESRANAEPTQAVAGAK